MHVRRITTVLVAASMTFATTLLGAGVAFAATSYPGGSTPPPTHVGGITFPATHPLTQTGSNIYPYLIVASIALVVGAALRIFTRARAAHRAS
jgi:hypothetical protein